MRLKLGAALGRSLWTGGMGSSIEQRNYRAIALQYALDEHFVDDSASMSRGVRNIALLMGQLISGRELEQATSPWSPERFASMCDALLWAVSGRQFPGLPSLLLV
jgi:hypothetical protein